MAGEYRKARDTRKIIAGILIIAIIAIGTFQVVNMTTNKEPDLVIYTYDSLLAWGKDANKTYDQVFGNFERMYNVKIEIRKAFSDAREMMLTAIQEKDNPTADIIIGVDNILIHEALANDLFEPYTPANISQIRQDLIAELDPEHHVIPFDFSLIALVYDMNYLNSSTTPSINNLTFEDLLNDTYANTLIVENPTLSSPGLSFLLSQIAVYEKILHKDWKTWWQTIKSKVRVASGWSEAYDLFFTPQANRHMVVSYGTDAAYSMYFYNSTTTNATLTRDNGQPCGWMQIEGIGLVKNAKHAELAKKFIDYFLSVQVQELIPTNNWMYPANTHATLPECYNYAINPNDVYQLNQLLSYDEIEANLSTWLEDWQTIMSS